MLSDSDSRVWPVGAVAGTGIAAYAVPKLFKEPQQGEVKHVPTGGHPHEVQSAEMWATAIGIEVATIVALAAVVDRVRMRRAGDA